MEGPRKEYRLEFMMTMLLEILFGIGIGFILGIIGGGRMFLGSKLLLMGALGIPALVLYFGGTMGKMDEVADKLRINSYKYQNHIIFIVGILSLIGGGILGGKLAESGKNNKKRLYEK